MAFVKNKNINARIRYLCMRFICVSALLLPCVPKAYANERGACGDSIRADSLRSYKTGFNYKQLILPASLITIGFFGVSNDAFQKLNLSVRNSVAEIRGNHYFRADDYLQYLPIASYVGLGVVGLDCKHSLRDRIAAGATAYLAMGIMVNTIKFTVNEKRPNSNATNSFPSGHTATVFMGAELVRQEYGIGLSICAYTVAAGVAFLRIYNDCHWLNDVITGAGIGILSARIGYWMLPLYQKWFHWNKSSSIAVLPSYDFSTKRVGFGIATIF